MTKYKYLFKLFLVVYGFLLIAHIWQEGFETYLLVGATFGGLAIAVTAHKNHGYAPLVFLLIHMLIEWYSHAISIHSYNYSILGLHILHVLLDFTFLYVELHVHHNKHIWLILFGALSFLMCVFLTNYLGERVMPTEPFKPWQEIIHHIVLGGMLGCVVSHLFSRQRLEYNIT